MGTDNNEDIDWDRAADQWRNIVQRMDAMQNPQSGLGTGRDRHTHTSPLRGEPSELTEDELDQLYERGRYARPIVERPAKDSVRGGQMPVPPSDRDAHRSESADSSDVPTVFRHFMITSEAKEQFRQRLTALRVVEKIDRALTDARLTGGAALVLITDDAADKSEPIDWPTFNEVKAIQVVDRFDLTASDYVSDITDEQFGRPSQFWYHPDQTGGVATDKETGETYGGELIHHSRVIPYFGRRVRNSGPDRFDGWAQPILEGAIETLKDMAMVTQAMASSVHEFQYDILKIDGLQDLISAQGTDKFEARMDAMALSRSMINATALDANGEDLEMRSVDFSGPIEVLGLLKENLSLIADIPMSILFGQTPAGLSSNDETGRDNYFDHVRQIRHRKHEPALRRLAHVLACERQSPFEVRTPDAEGMPAFTITWPELDEPSAEEEAQRDKTQAEAEAARAQAIQGDVKLGILSPREAQTMRHPDTLDGPEASDYSDMARKAESIEQEDAVSDVDTTPPKGAQEAARRALRWRDEHPDELDAGTRVGWATARMLADGEAIEPERIVEKMNPFFQRHMAQGNHEIDEAYEGEPWRDNGYVAHLMWGGDTGASWAERKAEEIKDAREDGMRRDQTDPNAPVKAGDGQPEKQRKRDVGYVNSAPSKTEQCDGCGWYDGERGCQIVRGPVAPSGWCRLWGTKVFAAGLTDDDEDDDSDVPQTPNTGFGANQDSDEATNE